MFRFVIFILVFISSIGASPKETLKQEQIYVGDTVLYSIEWENDNTSDVSLSEGKFYEDNSLPSFEILSVKKEENRINASVIFFTTGEFFLPTTWKENGLETHSKLKITVLSNLTGQETEIEDIDPPIVFSGPFALRLIGLILFTCFNLYILYALYLYWKSKPKIVDALWEKNPKLPESTKRLHHLETYLNSDEISEKELIFKVSEYLKEVYSEQFKENLLGCTDSEFLAILHDKTHIPDGKIRDLRLYFRTLKYTKNKHIISKEDALTIWEQIKKDFLT